MRTLTIFFVNFDNLRKNYVPTTLLHGHSGPKGVFALEEFLLVSRLGRHMDIVLHLVPQILNGI